MKFLNNVSLLILMLLSSTTVLAQETKHSDPTDPAALVPAIKYESAFSDYRPFQEQKVAPWKQVLDEVTGIVGADGHAEHGGMSETSTAKEVAPSADVAAANSQTLSPAPAESTDAPATEIAARGLILQIDKANAKVKIAHDPIASLGWPKMTMFFRLKQASMADQVKENEKLEFFLEKSSNGYVISRFGKISGPGKQGDR